MTKGELCLGLYQTKTKNIEEYFHCSFYFLMSGETYFYKLSSSVYGKDGFGIFTQYEKGVLALLSTANSVQLHIINASLL